jgi:hypothetical protein
MNPSRRSFLTSASALGAAAAFETGASESLTAVAPTGTLSTSSDARISLDGFWQFQLDPLSIGEILNLPDDSASAIGWKDVRVPHTWQIDESSSAARHLSFSASNLRRLGA